MKSIKKIFMTTLALALMHSGLTLQADEACVDLGGCGYEESCRSSTLAPAIALGAIIVVAVVAVAVQNTSGHSHCHCHH